MGLTQVSKDGVKNDAIDASKLPANSVGASELADNAVDTNAISNNAVTAGKLASGVQTTINNNASTKFITGTNNANELDCETNLSYNNSIVNFANSNLSIDKSSNPTITLTESTGNKATQLRQDTGGLLRTLGNYPLLLGTNQVERFRITGEGSVGIGESSPTAKVTIQGSNSTDGTLRLQPHSNKGNSVSHIHHGSNGDWYIRPASASGYVYHDVGKSQFTNGILFGSDTAAANALDDYEEGNWTPSLSQSFSLTNYRSTYIKIGRLVTAYCYFKILSNISGNNNRFQINGLPFNADSASYYHGGGFIAYMHNSNYSYPLLPLIGGGGTSYIYFHRQDGTTATWTYADMHNIGNGYNGQVILSVVYQTA